MYVAASKLGEAAGEGLYAKKHIRKGQLVCLFNGVRWNKTGHHTRICANDDDWSDYRLTLGIQCNHVILIALIKVNPSPNIKLKTK